MSKAGWYIYLYGFNKSHYYNGDRTLSVCKTMAIYDFFSDVEKQDNPTNPCKICLKMLEKKK